MGRTVEPALMGQRIEWQDEGGAVAHHAHVPLPETFSLDEARTVPVPHPRMRRVCPEPHF